MWFKTLHLYQLQSPINSDPKSLSNTLEALAFKPCPKSLPQSMGFVPPLPSINDHLALAQKHFMLLQLRIEQKVLPPAVVREQLNQQVKEFEQKAGRRMYKDEKERLKDEVYHTLLTQAFTQSSYVNGYIDTEKNWLIIDCANEKKRAHFASMLHKALQNPITALALKPGAPVLTQWAQGSNQPHDLYLNQACLLKSPEENGIVARIKNENLLTENIQRFLASGAQVIELAVGWNEQIKATIRPDFSLSGIRFSDAVKEQSFDPSGQSKEEQMATDFLIMAETLQHYISAVLPYFIEGSSAASITDVSSIRNDQTVDA